MDKWGTIKHLWASIIDAMYLFTWTDSTFIGPHVSLENESATFIIVRNVLLYVLCVE